MNYQHFDKFKLCFVGNGVAYFTSQDVAAQDGHLWDKVPYENGAGAPYVPQVHTLQEGKVVLVLPSEQWSADGTPGFQCLKVLFEAAEHIELVTLSDLANGESMLSVREINAQGLDWLHARRWSPEKNCYVMGDSVKAGDTIGYFAEFIKRNGGTLYVPDSGLAPYPIVQNVEFVLH